MLAKGAVQWSVPIFIGDASLHQYHDTDKKVVNVIYKTPNGQKHNLLTSSYLQFMLVCA